MTTCTTTELQKDLSHVPAGHRGEAAGTDRSRGSPFENGGGFCLVRPCGLTATRAGSGRFPWDQQGMAVLAWAHGNVPPNLPQPPLPAQSSSLQGPEGARGNSQDHGSGGLGQSGGNTVQGAVAQVQPGKEQWLGTQ